MFLLSKKVLLILFVLLTSFLLIFPSSINAVSNPQDVFEKRTLPFQIETRNNIYDQAAKDGVPYSSLEGSVDSYAAEIPLGFTRMMLCLPGDKTCNPQNTALHSVSSAIALLYANPPASGIYYAQDLMQNAGILAKPAYAQGIGFAGLSPLLPIWKVTRNIAYAAVILVMIIIGFMVIFRAKIDPKTVISVQAAIPKIIITLLLITFSYPIAGFLVDLMYLSIGIVVSMLAGGFGHADKIAQTQSYFLTADVGDLFKTVFSGGFSTYDDFLLRNAGSYLGAGASVTFITSAMQWLSLGPAAWVGALGIGALFALILALGLLFTFIRIALLLLNSYIQLLIGVVIAPIQLLFEAIPGRSAFSDWLLNIIANLVVFPTTVAILMFAEYIAEMNNDTSSLFGPPLTAVPGKGSFSAFLALGILFLAPTLIATVKKQFKPKPLLPITAGTAFAPLTGATQTAMGSASQFYYLQSTFANLPGPLKGMFGGGERKH